MAPTNPTEPGWYPDPWGTAGERRWDGHAWGRETRPGAGTPAPDPATSAPPGGAATPPVPAPASTGPLPPAAWYPDPAGSPGLRYWDGAAWTAHTAYTDGPATTTATAGSEFDAPKLAASARSLGNSLRVLLLFAGPALALQAVTTALYMRQLAPTFRRMIDHPNRPIDLTMDMPRSFVLSMVSNVAGLTFMATGLIFIIWLGTSGKAALAAGRPLRRHPWLGAWSFAIPIVNLWWPYRAVKDLLAVDDPARATAKRWWAFWIVAMLLQPVGTWAAMFGAPDAVIVVVVAVTAAAAIGAALAARGVIAAVSLTQEPLAGEPAQA